MGVIFRLDLFGHLLLEGDFVGFSLAILVVEVVDGHEAASDTGHKGPVEDLTVDFFGSDSVITVAKPLDGEEEAELG
jgi:hypothetical protein